MFSNNIAAKVGDKPPIIKKTIPKSIGMNPYEARTHGKYAALPMIKTIIK
jgi:hypothetical protein